MLCCAHTHLMSEQCLMLCCAHTHLTSEQCLMLCCANTHLTSEQCLMLCCVSTVAGLALTRHHWCEKATVARSLPEHLLPDGGWVVLQHIFISCAHAVELQLHVLTHCLVQRLHPYRKHCRWQHFSYMT